MSKANAAKARRRAEMILRVRGGGLTANVAAQALGVSRKTYYQWEKRALEGMLRALEDRRPGRPALPVPDPEKARLEKRVGELESLLDLAGEVDELRRMLAGLKGGTPPVPGRRAGRELR